VTGSGLCTVDAAPSRSTSLALGRGDHTAQHARLMASPLPDPNHRPHDKDPEHRQNMLSQRPPLPITDAPTTKISTQARRSFHAPF